MGAGKYGPLLIDAGVDVVCLEMPQGKLTLRGISILWGLLRNGRSAVVQTWMYHADFIGGVLARLAGVKRIIWGVHNTTLDRKTSRFSTRLIAKANAFLSSWVPDVIVCCAERARLVHNELGYVSSRMTVIPNGYDLDKFFPDSRGRDRLRGEWGVGPAEPVLGMVARFDPAKDHSNLLGALGELRKAGVDFTAVLIGRGMDEDNAQLVDCLNRQGLQGAVILLGARSDIPAVMSALDFHVLSSKAEAFPNVLAEAMACCTPCITTDVGDAAVIVGDTGWVVASQNSKELASSMKIAIELRANDSSQWAAMRQRARDRISSNFSIGAVFKKYELIWRAGF